MELENQHSNGSQVSRVMGPLGEASGWMKFVGVLSIIQGVLTALSIIGILVAWIPIWIGVLLFSAANHSQRAVNTQDESQAIQATSKLKTLFILYGVLALIMLIFVAVAFTFGVAGILTQFGMEGWPK